MTDFIMDSPTDYLCPTSVMDTFFWLDEKFPIEILNESLPIVVLDKKFCMASVFLILVDFSFTRKMAEELKNATSEDSFFRKDFEVDISNKESCRTFIVEPETPTPVNFANVKETDEFSVQCDEVTEQLQFLQNEKDTLKRSIKGFDSPFTSGTSQIFRTLTSGREL